MSVQYEELMDQIEELCCTFNAFAIAIDGMALAGKTDLAAHLSRKFGAPIIHMSDFLLPVDKRQEGWEDIPGSEVDFERFDEEIVQKWLKQRPIVYDIMDPVTGEITDRIALPDGQIYIVEGTYCLHPAILDFYDLRLFCRVSSKEQARRAEAEKKPLTQEELARQDGYFTTYMTELLADFVVDEDFCIPAPVEVEEEEEEETE